jgi:beta-lactamase class A
MRVTSNIKLRIALLTTVSLFIGSIAGYAYKSNSQPVVNQTQYPLLSRRIQIDSPSKVKINFTSLRKDLTDYLAGLDNGGSNVSVYFEYLPTGIAININEKNQSIAASLMKLPVIMNLYKASEMGQVDMDKKVQLKKEWLNSEYGTLYEKGEGYEITIREAARLALKDSDNTALLLIWDQLAAIDIQPEDDSLNYLDIEYGVIEDDRAQIGARSYTSILKCLYYSCFNNNDDSEQILTFMTESSFHDRLTKYLPDDLKVSHKIGTYTTRYQSDCGLVYLESKRYALCIMVEGQDPVSSQIIADLSQKVYLHISQN